MLQTVTLKFPRVNLFPPQKLVAVEKMKIEFLKNIARPFFICVRKVRPHDIRPYARMTEVVVACNCVLN